MIEKTVVFIIIFCLIVMFLADIISPNSIRGRGRQNMPAALPYDVHDFCAYHSHIVLTPFEKGGARFLFDCLLPGTEEPIEMIMLARSGIYVFEHVRASGWISGMESNEQWTEKIQMGYGRKPHEEKFKNPVTVVEEKAANVKEALKLENTLIRSLVVFPEFCLLNNIKVINPNVRVVTLNQLLPAVVTLNNKTGINLTQRDINAIYNELVKYELVPDDEGDKELEVQ